MPDPDPLKAFIILTVGAAIGFLVGRSLYSRLLPATQRQLNDLAAKLISQQQQSLYELNERHAILSSMVEGVIVVRVNERIMYASPNKPEYMRYARHALPGRVGPVVLGGGPQPRDHRVD
jgi:hypothetical protein